MDVNKLIMECDLSLELTLIRCITHASFILINFLIKIAKRWVINNFCYLFYFNNKKEFFIINFLLNFLISFWVSWLIKKL